MVWLEWLPVRVSCGSTATTGGVAAGMSGSPAAGRGRPALALSGYVLNGGRNLVAGVSVRATGAKRGYSVPIDETMSLRLSLICLQPEAVVSIDTSGRILMAYVIA